MLLSRSLKPIGTTEVVNAQASRAHKMFVSPCFCLTALRIRKIKTLEEIKGTLSHPTKVLQHPASSFPAPLHFSHSKLASEYLWPLLLSSWPVANPSASGAETFEIDNEKAL